MVRRLEAGGLTLEESLALWERGEQLAELCQHWLDRARERLAAAAPADARAVVRRAACSGGLAQLPRGDGRPPARASAASS